MRGEQTEDTKDGREIHAAWVMLVWVLMMRIGITMIHHHNATSINSTTVWCGGFCMRESTHPFSIPARRIQGHGGSGAYPRRRSSRTKDLLRAGRDSLRVRNRPHNPLLQAKDIRFIAE